MRKGLVRFGLPGLIVVTLAVALLFLGREDDPLYEVRRISAAELVIKKGDATWHDFQFVEPCSSVEPKLLTWKEALIRTGSNFAMSDMEDLEFGPLTWSPPENFSLSYVPELKEGMKCAFAVSPSRRTTWFDRLRVKMSSFLGG